MFRSVGVATGNPCADGPVGEHQHGGCDAAGFVESSIGRDLREVVEQVCLVFPDGLSHGVALVRVFGADVEELVAVIVGVSEVDGEEVKDRQQSCLRIGCGVGGAAELRTPGFVVATEDFDDEVVLGTEVLVQRGFGHTGVLPDLVHADGMDPGPCEQLCRGGYEALSGGAVFAHDGAAFWGGLSLRE